MKPLERMLASVFGKLPSLPANIRDALVKLAPYFAIVGCILSLPAILTLVGLGAVASPIVALGGAWAAAGSSALALIFAIISVVLLGLSISGLFAGHEEGWRYLFYNSIAGGVYAILNADLGSLIIGTGISLYVLFQIRPSYK